MKKVLIVSVLIAALNFSGVLSTAKDFGTIGIRYVTGWGKKAIPVAIDIDRLELSLKQLDVELASNGRLVVEESVALDRFVEQATAKERSLAQLKSDLIELRDKFVKVSCNQTKSKLETAMSNRLTKFKAQSQTLDSIKTTLDRKRESYERIVAAYEKQKSDRDILSEKLESFRAEYASMRMRGELEQSTLVNSASSKASDLAIEIADRLEIQRRLAIQRSDAVDFELNVSRGESKRFDITEVESAISASNRVTSR